MLNSRVLIFTLLFAAGVATSAAFAQDSNLQPKYGTAPKNEIQIAADQKFLASIDAYYKGDRKKAAVEVASRGWNALRRGDRSDAMRRFNQAWLIDHNNGTALWGMAVIQAETESIESSMQLLSEAEKSIGDDIDFAVDYTKTLGMVGAQTRNVALLTEAFTRFTRLYEKAPQHTLNLQNWAITLFYIGNYREAWKKIQLAEGTPRRTDLDPRFLADLQSKMPRP